MHRIPINYPSAVLDGVITASVQPIVLLELSRQIRFGQILKIFIGEGIELVLKAAREHSLYFVLPFFFLKPLVLQQLARTVDIFVVEFDPNIARQAIAVGVAARETDELRLRDGHSLAFES